MDNIGGHVNPLHLVKQLPAGMEIPGLRDRLVLPSAGGFSYFLVTLWSDSLRMKTSRSNMR